MIAFERLLPYAPIAVAVSARLLCSASGSTA
jgi:hypothetical protein